MIRAGHSWPFTYMQWCSAIYFTTYLRHWCTMTCWKSCWVNISAKNNKLCARPPQYSPTPCKLTVDLFTLKVVSDSRVMCATSVAILVVLNREQRGLGPRPLCSRLRPDVRDRQMSEVHHRLMPPTLGVGHNSNMNIYIHGAQEHKVSK